MVFEEYIEANNVTITKPDKDSQVRINLEPKREFELQKINNVYSRIVFNDSKKIGRTKLIKMAIDNLIANIENLSEEEAVEYLRTLYKEAEF